MAYLWTKMLKSSVAVLALGIGGINVANGQGVGIFGAAETRNGGLGTGVSMWLPLSGPNSAGFGVLLETNVQKGSPYGSFGFNYRHLFGSFGLGGLAAFNLEHQTNTGNQFYSLRLGGELGLGALTVRAEIQLPIADKSKVIKGSSTAQGIFVNKPASTACTNPANTNDRLCDLRMSGKTEDIQKNRFGFNINAEYDLNLGMINLTPQAGLYVVDRSGKSLVGFEGGAQAAIRVSQEFEIYGSAGLRYDRENKGRGVFMVGVNWNIGGIRPDSNTPTFMTRAPKRFQPGVNIERVRGQNFQDQVLLKDSTSGVPVQEVQFIDATVANPNMKIQNMPVNSIIVVQGQVNLDNASVNMQNNHVMVVGGNSKVEIIGANTGRTGILDTPGSRGVIRQSNAQFAFQVDNHTNIMFHGLDIISPNGMGTRGISTLNTPDLRFRNLNIDNFAVFSISLDSSQSAILSDLQLNRSGNNSLSINAGSDNVLVERVTITNSGANAVEAASVKNLKIRNVRITESGTNGIVLVDQDNALVEQAVIEKYTEAGVLIAGGNNIVIRDSVIFGNTNSGDGVIIDDQAKNILLSNLDIKGANAINKNGISVGAMSENIRFQNVRTEGWLVGFSLTDGTTTVVDLGGNRFDQIGGIGQACDGMDDVMPVTGIQVQVNNGGTITCR